MLKAWVVSVAGSRSICYLAAGCLVVILILSLWPGHWQERMHLPGPIDHFVAYFGAGAIFVLAQRRLRYPIIVVATLAGYAALMEILQNLSPGRDPQIVGFLASTCGAALGAVAVYAVRRAYTA